MVRSKAIWVAGILALLVMALAGQANAAVLYDQQKEDVPTFFFVSQDFETAFDDRDTVGADDFTVPDGKEWQLDSVVAHGVHLGAGNKPSAYRVTVYGDAAGMPGSVVYEKLSTTYDPYPGRTLIQLGVTDVLPAGKYWMSVQAVMNSLFDGSQEAARWFWRLNDNGPFGSPAVFKNPGDGWPEFNCVEFATLADCGFPAGAHNLDFSFALNGTESLTSECEAASEAVATAIATLGKARNRLSRANKALAKVRKAVRKASSGVKRARKSAKKKARQALRKAKAKANKAQRPVRNAKRAANAANQTLSAARSAQTIACG